MTPQERLQEAKDQAAKELHCKSWDKAIGQPHEYSYHEALLYDRVAEIMYETGKKEGDTSLLDKACATAQKYQLQSETFRKALQDLVAEIGGFDDGQTRRILSIINKALKPYADQFKPKWVQVVDRLPEKSIDEILVRGGELYDEKKHYIAEFSKGYFYDVNDVRIYPHEWMYIPS